MDLTDSSVYDGGIPAKGPSMNSKPLPKIQSFLKELKRNQPAAKKQTLQEWSMAGGGVPTQYKGREHVWHAKVNKFAAGGEVKMAGGGDPRGEMKAYDPTIRERMADALQRGLEGLGGNRYKSRRTAQTFMGGPSSNAPMNLGFADAVPFLGTALGVDEGARDLGYAYDAVKRGDYVDAAANTVGAAAGLIPGAAGTIKGAKAAGRGALAAGRAGARFADRAVPKIMERGGMGAEMLQGMSRGTVSPLDVYHGSPYKFDRFDASKIGSGEGAQVYGHGLYFAEVPEVAKGYQATLGHKGALDLEHEAIQRGIPLSREAQIELMRQSMRDMPLKITVKNLQNANIEARSLDEDKLAGLVKDYKESKQGSLYKVDLPDEQIAKMLDWDKPMTESEMNLLYDKMQQSPLASFAKPFQDNFYSAMERGHKTPDGQDLFMELSKQLGGQKYVSEALRELGIPGIKYLDEGSRGASGSGKWKLKFPTGEEKIYDFKPDDDVLKMMNATAEPHVTRNFVTFPGEEQSMTILERNGQPMVAPTPEGMANGGAVYMAGGGAAKTVVEGAVKGVKKLLGMADEAPKGVEPIVVKPKPEKEPVPLNYSQKVLDSTAARFAEKIAAANPKLSDAEVAKKAMTQATKKLEWERTQKPALEKQYGALAKSSYAESNLVKQQNTPEVVQERMRKANEFLDIPTEAWTPPRSELQAFDRSSIRDALEGFPGVEQSKFPRDIPSRANIEHVEGLYTDPANRALIEKQIKRGLPLGGESFYASLYPVKQAVLEAGMPAEKFDQWIHSLAPASARNSIMNEMAVGQFMRDMNARGIPLTEENVAREMAVYKEKFGIGLPLMPLHRQGVANVIEGGQNLRDMSLANIPTNYKIPTYGSQKAGDFANSVVLDVHEAGGQTQGSRFHPYFNEQGGFGNTEYNAGEQGMLGIAKDLGIPGGMAQAGRWFGGGELTGLKSPRGDALDLLEKQVAYTLQQKGVQPNPANVRAEVLRQIETGEGDLLPWYRKEGMPDVRQTGLQRAEGGEVNLDESNLKKHKPSNIMFGKTPAQQHKRGGLSSIK